MDNSCAKIFPGAGSSGAGVPYRRKIHYYETDKMGVVHHSNYIRWMEEARVDLLDRIGCPFTAMEEKGISVPVVSVRCRYLSPLRFDDVVEVALKLEKYTGVRMIFSYEIRHFATGRRCATGKTEHCFLNDRGRITPLASFWSEADEAFRELCQGTAAPAPEKGSG